jgi:hypothetical protein
MSFSVVRSFHRDLKKEVENICFVSGAAMRPGSNQLVGAKYDPAVTLCSTSVHEFSEIHGARLFVMELTRYNVFSNLSRHVGFSTLSRRVGKLLQCNTRFSAF